MRRVLLACFALFVASATHAAEWRVRRIDAPARVSGIETVNGEVRAYTGGLWYVLVRKGEKVSLTFRDGLAWPKLPDGALPDSKVAVGQHDIARAWLAEPTDRYDHGILGDKIEANALVIEMRDGKQQTVRLRSDAVFEDLQPRIADLDGDGHDEVLVVKSYLKRGSALAIVGERRGKYEIVAETPPLGAPHRWLNPVGIADFTGGGKTDFALVRQPHAVGALEIWSWQDDRLQKVAEIDDASNHIVGTRALDMSVVADFDGDGIADIAVPSFDRSRLRIISFAGGPHDIANVALPAKAVTNLGLIKGVTTSAVALGLADGSLVLIERAP
jgi:hypothetical protein